MHRFLNLNKLHYTWDSAVLIGTTIHCSILPEGNSTRPWLYLDHSKLISDTRWICSNHWSLDKLRSEPLHTKPAGSHCFFPLLNHTVFNALDSKSFSVELLNWLKRGQQIYKSSLLLLSYETVFHTSRQNYYKFSSVLYHLNKETDPPPQEPLNLQESKQYFTFPCLDVLILMADTFPTWSPMKTRRAAVSQHRAVTFLPLCSEET